MLKLSKCAQNEYHKTSKLFFTNLGMENVASGKVNHEWN